MGIRSQIVDAKESTGIAWVWDILSDPTESGIVINATCPHLQGGWSDVPINMTLCTYRPILIDKDGM